jgi:diguanylate cyclase (GGDEF)-like protein/PAS domain S-box-containing protein
MLANAMSNASNPNEAALSEMLFCEANEGMMITDAQNRILRVNRAFCSITGFGSSEVVGRTPRVLSSGRHEREFYERLWAELHAQGRWQGEIWNRRKDGSSYPQWLSIVIVRDAELRPTHHVAVFSDITRWRTLLDKLEMRANVDPLTQLPNRNLFMDRLKQALAAARRSSALVAVAFLDLDRFKSINDSWGHQAGDALLQAVALRMSASLREGDSVARIGGDEFALLLPGLESVAEAQRVVGRVLAALGTPLQLDTRTIAPTASIGLALFPEHGQTPYELLARADEAMYLAKHSGGGCHRVSGHPVP